MPGRKRGPVLAPVPVVREVIELIDRSGWKNWEVAKVAGVSTPYISKLRTGARTDVSVACLEAMLGVFGRRLVIGSLKNGKPGSPKHRRKPGRLTKEKPKRSYAGQETD